MKPGWVWSRQTCWWPALHSGQMPQAVTNGVVTRSPDPSMSDVGADRDDGAGQLVPGNVRQRDVRVVPLPRVPVAAAHPRGRDGDHDPVCRRLRIGHVDDPRRLPNVSITTARIALRLEPVDGSARTDDGADGVLEDVQTRGRVRPR